MTDWLSKNWKWLAGGACGALVAVITPVSTDAANALYGACAVAFTPPVVDAGKRIAEALQRTFGKR